MLSSIHACFEADEQQAAFRSRRPGWFRKDSAGGSVVPPPARPCQPEATRHQRSQMLINRPGGFALQPVSLHVALVRARVKSGHDETKKKG